ncbi:hypothetical protein [Thaumasiovibrio sp. DFM-14]|uniref:hypothetical protein n=1 Tax=Thaumasiovibrio sp. DFM-14 TaxID=3384792 RepID=UPI0039A2ED1C
MTMVSAREFAHWLRQRFSDDSTGVSLTRNDINQLTGRQNFSQVFINDIHYELMRHGMAFVTDTTREKFYLVSIIDKPWREQLEKQYEKELYCNNILPFDYDKSG